MIRRQTIYSILLLLSIYIAGGIIQSQFFINWDVAWDIDISKRLLAGGTYEHDFFDLNPPLILYLYMPVVFFKSLFSMNAQLTLFFYISILAFSSLYLCYFILSKLLICDRFVSISLILTLAFLYFVFPLTDFGEREHLLIILTMPYILSVSLRLQGNHLPVFIALIVGFLSGLGFAIKPYFIIVPLFVELYAIYFCRNYFGWVRLETLIIAGIFILQCMLIFIVHPDFSSMVVPLGMHFYYDSFKDSWSEIVFNSYVYFCLFVMTLACLRYKEKSDRPLVNVLFVAEVAFLLIYLLQRTSWHYHILPAFSIGCLLFILIMPLLVEFNRKFQTKLVVIVVNVVVISWAASSIVNGYKLGNEFRKNQTALIEFLTKTVSPSQSVYFFDAAPAEFYSAVNYAHVPYASRFLHLFWLPGIVKNEAMKMKMSKSTRRWEDAANAMVIDDIVTKAPDYILVDVKDFKGFYHFNRFEYLHYFMKKPEFREIWKNYEYVRAIKQYHLIPIHFEDWSLYISPRLEDAKIGSLKKNAVILTGTNNPRTAYFIRDMKLLKEPSNNAYLNRSVLLTEEERDFIAGQKGLVTPLSHDIYDVIMDKAIINPAYEFQVYKRRKDVS